ncbi:ABC transporter substrate-binding protein [Pseudothauera nasutitermitis]|nr:ABC transporter substrate-binding protein [Pseudothauera nasutitermitis]
MNDKLLRPALAASLVLILSGAPVVSSAQAGGPRQIAHVQGITEVPGIPARVAATSLSGLDTLDALGIEVAAVPAPPSGESTARWPARLLEKYGQDKYAKIGGGRAREGEANPQVERIKALKPDLVVVDGRSRNLYSELKGAVPVIDLSVSNASFIASVVQNILGMGAAFGQERQAGEQAHALLGKVRALHEEAAKQGTGLVLFAVGNRVMPQQVDARFGMIYEVSGIRPVLHATESQGLFTGRPQGAPAADTPEAKAAAEAAQKARQEEEARLFAEVMAREPDWLFVVDRNAAFGEAKAAEAMAATPVIANSRAWRAGKVVYLDQDGASWYLMAGGLGLLESSIRQIQEAFDKAPAPAGRD